MPKFLIKTAEYLYRQYGNAISDICIVLPNRRAGLYLKKHLADLIKKSIWAPFVFSIEDFMIRLSHLKVCDPTEVLFELYEVHKILEGEKAQEFDEFIHWGQQLIGDFNEIDSYLVNSAELFAFLNEAKALTLWNLENTPLTDFEKQYLHFFNSLNHYHELLTSRLLASGQAYPGLLFRKTSEMIPSLVADLEWKKVVFAGFNAMTKSEEILIDALVESGKGEILWDADAYYLEDDKQEAGYFLRNWRKKWKNIPFQWMGEDFKNSSKTIRITGVPLHVGQTKFCGELLSEIDSDGTQAENTAVVMMDEQLLVPLLNSLPENVNELNITMGLPLRQTPLFDLLDTIFRMHVNIQRFSLSARTNTGNFYFRDVLKILQHPYMSGIARTLTVGSPFSLEDLIHSIKNGNMVFLGKKELYQSSAGLFSQNLSFIDPLFEPWNNINEALRNLKQFIGSLHDGLIRQKKGTETRTGQLELEFLFAFSKIIFKLSALSEKYNSIKNIQTLYNLFKQIAGFTSLPFYGEPLKGIQIMGMLETRTLDFDKLILLSANEDLLPAGKTTQSFIPFDIRRHFQLPTYKTKYSIFAYHFYRLLQRASTIHLLYNTEADELGGGEKSRFIKQILHELTTYNPSIKIEEDILVTTPPIGEMQPIIQIPKTGDVYDKLMNKAVSGISPTALNNWVQCSLKFYFKDLLGLEEPREIKDTIDAQILGLAVHKALEILFAPYKNSKLEKVALESMIKNHEAAVDQAFRKKYQGFDVSFGKNHLLVKVGKIMVRRYLYYELKNMEILATQGLDLILYNLEQYIERKIEIPNQKGSLNIKLKGFIDRINRVGEDWQIIDYKSGKVSAKDLVLEDWQLLQSDPEFSKILQLLTYVYLFNHNFREDQGRIMTGIISLRKINEGFMQVILPEKEQNKGKGNITGEDILTFEKVLIEILESIFDPYVPFQQTEDNSRCEYCDFIDLCGR